MNSRKRNNPRKYRRKKLDDVLEKINAVIAKRDAVGDTIFEGREFTESMVKSLDEGTFHDKLLQEKWARFKDLTREFEKLQNIGADLVAFKHNNKASKGKHATDIRSQATR